MDRLNFLIFLVSASFVSAILTCGCLDDKCYSNADCAEPKYCDTATGDCVYECRSDDECSAGFICQDYHCAPDQATDGDGAPLVCPDDMASVADSFCIDRYEASRPDATATSAGTDESAAHSEAGVIPWQVESNAAAEAACEASGKRLCASDEWKTACRGPDNTEYAYGNEYVADTCNGIDAFGRSDFHLTPTGFFPDCTNEWGVFDINGNLWEHVAGGSDVSVRGGAYNCSDSVSLHRCDYIPGNWSPSARGFRCCLSRETEQPDGDANEDIPDGDLESDSDGDGGCIDDPDGDKEEIPLDGDTLDSDEDGDNDGESLPDGDSDQADGDHDDAEADGDLTVSCPTDMVLAAGFCIDRYEASRPDATNASQGSNGAQATSRANVLPWQPVTLAQARTACEAADKRLCRTTEWVSACSGSSGSAYIYGNDYSADTCNGIDAFCDCSSPACASAPECPYPHCRVTCGASFHVMPTGSFPSCVNESGAFDINGNVWEIVDAGDGVEHFRGGAYNCGDSEALHRCDYDATWGPSARGFRCCRDAEAAQ
jgi:formylglycine-generating enzyme required for sulfatase activity